MLAHLGHITIVGTMLCDIRLSWTYVGFLLGCLVLILAYLGTMLGFVGLSWVYGGPSWQYVRHLQGLHFVLLLHNPGAMLGHLGLGQCWENVL